MTKLIYKGKGKQFISGVPARDISDEELKNVPDESIAEWINSGLYEKAEVEKEEKGKKEAVNG